MGKFPKGTDIAREMGHGLHADAIEAFGQQLLIVFLKRLGGKLSVPVAEVDDTGQDMLAFSIDEDRVFHFELRKKS